MLSLRPLYYVGYYAYYEMNIDYIVENYCINKEKPELNCNGKCYLMQQLALNKAESRSDAQSKAMLSLVESFTPLFHTTTQTVQFKNQIALLPRVQFAYKESHSSFVKKQLLRPPIS